MESSSKQSENRVDDSMQEIKLTPLLDYESSLARLGGDKSLFEEFVHIFFDDSPSMLSRIQDAVEKDDAGELAKAAHAIKGLTSNFGAKAFCELALEFELAGKNGKAKPMSNSFDSLQRLYDQICCELKRSLL